VVAGHARHLPRLRHAHPPLTPAGSPPADRP
jgi:hypothetical protein